ncbi:hypothetical protein M427DRAFT_45888 [Gonapodya prolifera JEL478]|uniref:Uncharacterized protein n=1 Tax=Gonapodya prolifera (strain JEL478) TaxID=1344416 RepID=A0A139A8W6_GONPJ|nr:hypothetical protein M427DRAFT_45888 [Gonapodya prolifera JEL478]|eukprot:KXS13128.1 hypothetical protein M427DRAFT_45888 [Gonapodya prolifera JEL478]
MHSLASSIKVLRSSLVPLPGNLSFIISSGSAGTLASIATNTYHAHLAYLDKVSDEAEKSTLLGTFLSATAQIIERIYSGAEQLEEAGKDKSGDPSAFEHDTDEVSDTEQDLRGFSEGESELSKQLRYNVHIFFDAIDGAECRNRRAKCAILGDTSQEVLSNIAQYRRLVCVKQRLLDDIPNECLRCGSKELVNDELQETLSCAACGVVAGRSTTALPSSKILTYEERKEVNSLQMRFGYEHLCYFRELLLKSQALEFVSMQQDVLDRILLQLKAEQVANFDTLTKTHWKGIMRRAGLTKFYKHWRSIKYAIDGVAPQRIDAGLQLHLETILWRMKTSMKSTNGSWKRATLSRERESTMLCAFGKCSRFCGDGILKKPFLS